MKIKIAITLFFIIFIVIEAYSEINIYLYSKITYSEVIKLRDIGKIESNNESIDPEDIEIGKSLLSDGLIDSKELRSFLMNYFDIINIYGTGTRILLEGQQVHMEPVIIGDGSITSGANIKIILKNNRIKVATQGTALGDGKIGEIIPIKLKNSRILKGLITSSKTVEIAL
jgi:hypothetical protein